MEVFYINLLRRTDRRDSFLHNNASIATFRRAEAIDGQGLCLDQLIRDGFVQEPSPDYSLGALGAALSHRQQWEQCISQQDVITVAEDDAVFNQHFAARAESLLADLPADWDIVLWGWNFDSILHVEPFEGLNDTVMHFNTATLGPRLPEFQTRRLAVVALRLLGAFGLPCYSISPTGAQRLLQRCFPLRDEVIHVPGLRRSVTNSYLDVAMSQHYRDLAAYVCFPPLVWTENDKTTSDIWQH